MTFVSTKARPPRSVRAIVQRTRGRAQGFATLYALEGEPDPPAIPCLTARWVAVLSRGLLRKQPAGRPCESLFSAHQIGRARSG